MLSQLLSICSVIEEVPVPRSVSRLSIMNCHRQPTEMQLEVLIALKCYIEINTYIQFLLQTWHHMSQAMTESMFSFSSSSDFFLHTWARVPAWFLIVFCCCSVDWCCTLMPLGLLNFWMDGWLFQTQFGISHHHNIGLHHSRSSPHCLWLLHLWNTPSFQPVTEVQLPHPQLEHLRLFSRTLATEGLIPNSFTSFISFHVFCCSSGLCFRCKSTKTKADPQRIHFIHAFRWMSKDKVACVLRSTEDNCERQKPHFHLNWFLAA